ncbi:MAG TPA: YheU family protein [Polyangiales bacterium]|nr:YheU family protein [Polyangiales bacterium]
MPSHIRVPADALSAEALDGLVEEFITREGTDYGQREFSLEDKRSGVLRQLQRGEVAIVFELESESTTLVTKQELRLLDV